MISIQPRWFHASTLVNTTLFFSGGTTGENINTTTILDQTLALDLSQPWSIDNPLFTALPPLSVPVSGHSMNRVPGTTRLLVAGGELSTNQTISPIQLYDAASGNASQWSSVPIPASTTNTTTPFHRLYHASITTGKDGVLLHGGYQSTAPNGTAVSSLVTLDPSNNFAPLSTAPVSKALNPPALARHTMTLTADGMAIILGGINSTGILANLSMAHIMDTQASNTEWKLVPLLGAPPDPRVAFSTVAVNTTTLLVYGGTSDYKSAFWVTFYLDLPSLTWSAPSALGPIPRRWGHTATMAGNIMVVSFGLSSHQLPDNTTVVLLDTTTNTWITKFNPQTLTEINSPNNNNGSNGHGLSIGAVLGIAFLLTVVLVGGTFCLFIQRKKRRTRNTVARESLGQSTPRAALGRQGSSESQGRLGRVARVLGFASIWRAGTDKGREDRPNSKRYSEFSLRSHTISIADRIAELGYAPVSLGYPESVVQQGMGMVPVSSYFYPNQACAEIEKSRDGVYETQVVFHDLTLAQKEALRLNRELEQYQMPDVHRTELLQFDDDD